MLFAVVRAKKSERQRLLPLARAGDVEAQFDLACEYDFERPKDQRRAYRWYLCAAEQGHAEAQELLAETLRDGAKPNLREAVKWFRRAAEQGNPGPQLSLGYALFYGKGVRRNREEALKNCEDAKLMGG